MWHKDKRHGPGTTTNSTGSIYSGTYVQNFLNGPGTITEKDYIYEGDFTHNKLEGKVKIY